MSHFLTLVVVSDAATPEAAIALANKMLEPYDEGREVEEWERPIDEDRLDLFRAHLAERGEAAPSLERLAEGWLDYAGLPAIAAGERVYELTTYNPDSKWDWHSVGGRWMGYYNTLWGDAMAHVAESEEAPNIVTLTAEAIARITEDPPFALLLPAEGWVERGQMGWFGRAANEQPEAQWAQRVEALLRRYQDTACGVVMDLHV